MEKVIISLRDGKDAIMLSNKKYISYEDLINIFDIKNSKHYKNVINYLLENEYLVRIFKGFFYVLSLEERRYGCKLNIFEAIAKGMQYKKIDNWYFGLYTALKLNNLTYEYFDIIYLITDRIKKKDPIMILDYRIKYVKIKDSLCKLGIKHQKNIRFSDHEKTVLDFIYLFRKNGFENERIINVIIDYLDNINRKKLKNYLKKYPKTISKFIEGLSI